MALCQCWKIHINIAAAPRFLHLKFGRFLSTLPYGPGAGAKALHKPGHERWAIVSKICFQQGISRSPQQCQDKFEGVRGDFQKIWDYEKNILSGKKSYWVMDAGEKKAIKGLKANMLKEIYDYIASWLPNSSRSTNPADVIDSLNNTMETG